MEDRWKICLFGRLAAQRQGVDVVRFKTRKAGSLLGLLAFYLERDHSRDNIVELIWPHLHVDGGRACLSVALNSLRKQLEPPDVPPGSVVIASRNPARLNPRAVITDLAEFAALVRALETRTNSQDHIRKLQRALNLYKGE